VVLWGALRWDTSVVLRRWQEAGLPLFSTDGAAVQPFRISFWTRLRYWWAGQSFHAAGPSSG
jgi:hypothetical protein